MCSYFCIGFIDFMLAGKKLTDYTNSHSPYDLKKNDNFVLFQNKSISIGAIDKANLSEQTQILIR